MEKFHETVSDFLEGFLCCIPELNPLFGSVVGLGLPYSWASIMF